MRHTLGFEYVLQKFQRLLVLHREQAQELAVAMPGGRNVVVVEMELGKCVSSLGSLLAGTEVPAGDDIEFVALIVLL